MRLAIGVEVEILGAQVEGRMPLRFSGLEKGMIRRGDGQGGMWVGVRRG